MDDPDQPPHRLSPLHIAALTGIPLGATALTAFLGLRFVGRLLGFAIAIYASVSNRDAVILLALAALVTLVIAIVATVATEQALLGPAAKRPRETRLLVRWTRAGVAACLVTLPLVAMAVREFSAGQARSAALGRVRAAAEREAEATARRAEHERWLTTGTPAQVVEAASELRRGYDEVERVVLEASNDDQVRLRGIELLGSLDRPRAQPMLRAIVVSEPWEGLATRDLDERYRDAAMRASYSTSTEGIIDAYQHERQAAKQVQYISLAQTASRERLGWYDARVECLKAPDACNEGGPLRGLWTALAAGQRIGLPTPGYRTSLVGGQPSAAAMTRVRGASPSGVRRYAFLAVPQEPSRSGLRAFCTDSAGIFCATLDGRTPRVEDSLCVVTGQPLPEDGGSARPDKRQWECEAAD
jgi:hypothetical protein